MNASTPGRFGKLPSLGDFVRDGLDDAFVSRLDAWIQRGLLALRASLGERWVDAYLGMPVWRFALAPTADETQGWIGVLAPSMDRVGRHYPLVLARGFGAREYACAVGAPGDDAWGEMEERLRGMIAGDTPGEPSDHDAAVVGVGADTGSGQGAEVAGTHADAPDHDARALANLIVGTAGEASLPMDPDPLFARAARLLLFAAPGASLWWWIDTDGRRHLVRAGQPLTPDLFVALATP